MARNDWLKLENVDPRGLEQDGLTVVNTTTIGDIFPPVTFPGGFFKSGRSIEIHGRGIWAATATPTLTWTLKVGSVAVVASAAITLSAIVNQAWEINLDVQTRTSGTAGTLFAMGHVNMGGITGQIYLPATGTAPAASSAIDFSAAQAVSIQVTWSAASASNTITGKTLKIFSNN